MSAHAHSVLKVYEESLKRPAAERAAFLDHACAGDARLRSAVEALLAVESTAEDFRVTTGWATAHRLHLRPGARLGPYAIQSLVGAGGMGDVYRARDTRLARTVAIKVISSEFAADPDRRHRFEREARTISALNHPHICTLHDIGSDHGLDYLVMEYLNGQTLAVRLMNGRLPVAQAVEYATQMADALAAAHRAGVIHLDVKPANVMITKAGAKLLDFGIATWHAPTAFSGVHSSAPTVESIFATRGTLAGTLGYMAPERLQGQDADARTDLFAFGAVLYEMLTGTRAFQGESAASIITAILDRDPVPLSSFDPTIPASLERLLTQCLAKDPEQRWASAHDAAEELRWIRETKDAGAVAATPVPTPGPVSRRRMVTVRAIAIGLLAFAVVGGGLLLQSRRAQALTDRDWIVLADFQNVTDDRSFEIGLKQALAVQLAQSPFLNLFPESRIRNPVGGTLALMRRPPTDALTPPVAQEICQREGLKAMLAGSIASFGRRYSLTLIATNCTSGDTIAMEHAAAASKEDVLTAVASVATAMRRRLGESLTSIQQYDVPIRATTSSIEALNLLGQALTLRDSGREVEAIPLLERAVELDPNFAQAWARLGAILEHEARAAIQVERADAAHTRAFQLRDKVTERERYYIEGGYYQNQDDLEKARRTYELWKATYPRDYVPWAGLAVIAGRVGDDEIAVVEAREAVRLSPTAIPMLNLANYLIFTNRLDEAEQTINDAFTRKIDAGVFHRELYMIAFLRGDHAGMQREVEWSRGRPDEAVFLGHRAATAAWSGRMREADALIERAKVLNARDGLNDETAALRAVLAYSLAMAGETAGATRMADAVVSIPATWLWCLRTYAIVGDQKRVEPLLAQFTAARPGLSPFSVLAEHGQLAGSLDVPAFSSWVNGTILLNRGKLQLALQTLQGATVYEWAFQFLLLPQYWRAYALLSAHRPSEAIAEFRTLIARRSASPYAIAGSLAHVGLARAYAAAGDRAASRKAYEDFFALWKSADPEVPILVAVKREYAALH